MKSSLLKHTEVLNAKCQSGQSIRKLHDGGGLYLWVYADGKKYWRLRQVIFQRLR